MTTRGQYFNKSQISSALKCFTVGCKAQTELLWDCIHWTVLDPQHATMNTKYILYTHVIRLVL